MNILGISAFYHDSAACLLVNGEILAAAQEERFTRIKHDASFPLNSINFCLNYANIKPKQIDYVIFYDKPFLKFERLLETYLASAPKGYKSFITSMPIWLKDKIFQKSNIIQELESISSSVKWLDKLLFSEHHLSHASSAFFPSPFNEAAILTLDGVGEWATTTISIGKKNSLEIIKEIHFPHSIGLLYSAFTYYCGFKVNSGEYKLMGLAPYGVPKYVDTIKKNLIDIKADGSYKLNMSYFDYCTELKMTNDKFDKLFGGPARKSESLITKKEMDIAASIQKVTEEIVLKLSENAISLVNEKNLCLAGGVALNCVANGQLTKILPSKQIWIQPASGDAGGAIGAALCAYHLMLKKPRIVTPNTDKMHGSLLGPSYNNKDISNKLINIGAKFKYLNSANLTRVVSKSISQGMVVGWHQGRMEFGPRSLGARSILADPRSKSMQKDLNLKIKFRESFRPFAPAVLEEDVSKWFDWKGISPYMLMVAKVKKEKLINNSKKQKNTFGIKKLNLIRSKIPSVTHVDNTARIQTVNKRNNPLFYDLIKEFKKITDCPVLVNTSFNIRGEPIVSSPEDAFRCFMGTNIDLLVVGNFLIYKKEQDKDLILNYKNKYELD